jgi:hypothetical protein
MQILTLRDPNALANPSFRTFLSEALKSNFSVNSDLSDVAEELFAYIQRPDMFMLVGMEDGEFRGLLLGHLPQSRMFPTPMITFLYCSGSRELRLGLCDRIMDIFVSHGYTKSWAWNSSGHSDKAWEKVLDTGRNQFKRLGSVYSVEVK